VRLTRDGFTTKEISNEHQADKSAG